MKKTASLILVSVFATALTGPLAFAENEQSMEERVKRLERLVNSKGLVDIMVRVESLQGELQRLLGEIELQKHNLEELKKRQRDLYVDIDRRLLQIERRATGTSQPVSPAVTTAPSSKSESSQQPEATTSSKQENKQGEQEAYQKAFDLLRALRYEKATQAFRDFLDNYPDGRYAHIAQYWLAETSYHTKKYETAVKDYQTLIDKYPGSPKRADALLKIGYSQFELKSYSKAQKVLKELIKLYPDTTEAGQADNLLQKIRLQKVR